MFLLWQPKLQSFILRKKQCYLSNLVQYVGILNVKLNLAGKYYLNYDQCNIATILLRTESGN